MFCNRCGNEIPDGAKYCTKCGNKVYPSESDNTYDEWFYISNNVRSGPYQLEAMINFVQTGQITKETLVWKKGMYNWLPASQTELEQALRNTVPPMPKDIVSNKFAWSLATVPILVSWFVEMLGFPFWVITISTIALNIIFLMLDSDELNKSGLNVNSWMWMGVVLVPAYLFVRASKTNKQYGYAITWCIMFILDLLI